MRLRNRMTKLARDYQESPLNFTNDYVNAAAYKPEDEQSWKTTYGLLYTMGLHNEIQ